MEFSVIIPSGGSASLAEVLRSVRRGLPPDGEVIVVLDGVSPSAALEEAHPGVRFAHRPGRGGPAAARNTGVRLAGGAWLVFLDDDVLPAEGSLAALQRAWRADPDAAQVAAVVPHPEVAGSLYCRLAYGGLAHMREDRVADGGALACRHFCTSLAAVPASVLARAGLFDERFDRPGYEDVELGWRLERAGTPLRYCAGAVGLHLRRMDRQWFAARAVLQGGLLRRLHERQPEMVKAMHGLPPWMQRVLLPAGICWPLAERLLPAIERMPPIVASPLLGGIFRMGLAYGYRRAAR